jgi:hypothetical protein
LVKLHSVESPSITEIGSWSQSYDFLMYNDNASVEVG